MPEASPPAAIVLKDLNKCYPPQSSGWRTYLQPFAKATKPALQEISFEVQVGETVALLGANGAGKSTLLRILATLLLPTSGQALIGGYDVHKAASAVRRNLGYHAGSDQGFYPRLTGRENLLFFGQLNHLTSAAAKKRIDVLADIFHLREALTQQVRTLSSGTTQRLSLARALLHKPSVLLLDEPTRSLDAIGAAEFRQFLSTEILRDGRTSLLFASHSLQEIELLANRVAVIHQGKLLAYDTLQSLLARTNAMNLEQAFFTLTGSQKLFTVEGETL